MYPVHKGPLQWCPFDDWPKQSAGTIIKMTGLSEHVGVIGTLSLYLLANMVVKPKLDPKPNGSLVLQVESSDSERIA